MTDDERAELRGMEALLALGTVVLNQGALDRLYFLRLRAAGVMTHRELLDAVASSLPEEPMPTEFPEWMKHPPPEGDE